MKDDANDFKTTHGKENYVRITLLIVLILILVVIFLPLRKKTSTHNMQMISTTPANSQMNISVAPSAPSLNPTQFKLFEQQELDELNYANYERNIQKNYPWFEILPFQEKGYFFYFNPDKKAFFGLLYPNPQSSTSIDAQVSTMKQKIMSTAAQKGIPTSKYPINWKVTPQVSPPPIK